MCHMLWNRRVGVQHVWPLRTEKPSANLHFVYIIIRGQIYPLILDAHFHTYAIKTNAHKHTTPFFHWYHFHSTAVLDVTSLRKNTNDKELKNKEEKQLRLIIIVPFPAKKHYLPLQNNTLYRKV